MAKLRRDRRKRPQNSEKDYSNLFTLQAISKALVDELADTEFAHDLQKFQLSKDKVTKSYRSNGQNFWKKIVIRIISSKKKLHKDTLKKYPSDCYRAFQRKFDIIDNYFMAEIAG